MALVFLSPVGGAGAQFFDNNGVPLAGGKLYTYAAGTTTPRAAYTTSVGDTLHTNPIVLDAGGRVPSGGEVWLLQGVYTKVVLTTSAGAILATWDSLSGINDSTLTSGAPSGSSLVGYSYSATATPRTVQDRLREDVSVKDFGAVGDGFTDDTLAIQLTLNSVPSSGGTVRIPRGKYLVKSPLILPIYTAIRIVGEGNGQPSGDFSATILVKDSSVLSDLIVVTSNGTTLENFTVQGSVGNSGDGISVRAANVTIKQVSCFTMGGNGISIGTLVGGEVCDNWLVEGVECKLNVLNGMIVSQGTGPSSLANGGTLVHPDFRSNNAAGLRINSSQSNSITGGSYRSNGTFGISFGPVAKNNVVVGGNIAANSLGAVQFESGSDNNAVFNYTTLLSQYNIVSPSSLNRVECIDGNRLVSGVKFPTIPAPSTDVNTLDEYKEGTFTPILRDSPTGIAATAIATGVYTKVGRLVRLGVTMSSINTTGLTATNQIYITGLPFTIASEGASLLNVSPMYRTAISSALGNSLVIPTAGTTYMAVYDSTTTSVAQLTVSAITSGAGQLFFTATYHAAS